LKRQLEEAALEQNNLISKLASISAELSIKTNEIDCNHISIKEIEEKNQSLQENLATFKHLYETARYKN